MNKTELIAAVAEKAELSKKDAEKVLKQLGYPFEITKNVISYINTKFFRFMVLLKKNTQHASSKVYSFVPIQDFSKSWTDEELYAKYDLDEKEIAFIESMIRPME